MYRLKNRQTGIPQAIRFHQPELNWTSRPGSFENIVGQIIRVRLGNPHYLQKHGWATDHDAVADELDAYMARVCLDNGWTKYVQAGESDAPPPTRARPSLRRSAGNAAAGASVLVRFINNSSEAVSRDVSERRATVCAVCPQNKSGDLSSFFTVPVSNAIRAALNLKRDMKLETSKDQSLGVCLACGCPLRLKLHLPIRMIAEGLTAESRLELDSKCWIPDEENNEINHS